MAVPKVKICGLTDVDNALACAAAGADMIGLVFFKKSPRNVSIEQARAITRALPDHVLAIGVFVNESYETILNIAEKCKLDGVQLHGTEPPALAEQLSKSKLKVIKAFFAARQPELSTASVYHPNIDYCLVEYGKGVLPGGNAETWDYGLASGMDTPAPLMLAGGLTPENVSDAIDRATPAAIDASSGVEARPGFKDIEKVKEFISNARA